MDQYATSSPSYLKNIEVVFLLPNCASILQPLDQGIIESFEHYYCKYLVKKNIFVIDQRLHLDETLMKVLDFIAESWLCAICVTSFQKCGCDSHKISDGEDATEFSKAKDCRGQVTVGVI